MNRKKQLQSAIVGIAMAASIVAAPFTGMVSEKTVSAESYDNYAKLLQYSMYFYDANMCGTGVDSNSQLTWRGNCHTSDEVDYGFHDAGDHVKFGLPQGYSASTLGWGYYEFKDSYDSLGLTSHYKTISDYFCKFFKESTKLSGDTVTSFCYQVGDGIKDHNEWCAPEKQGDRGGALWTSSEGSDIAAEYAAALALNYINFGNEDDLKYAKALYKYAKQVNRVASTGIGEFYVSSSYEDDLAWAAGWLYLATNDSSYKTDCANYQVQYLGWVHDWNNVSLGAACVYAHITGDWSKVNSWISGQTTSNNYWFLLQWGSARYNASMQLCALAASKNSSADYSSWCKSQMTYLLGQNPANTCFVTGFSSNSAKNAHHRAASGYSSYEEMDKSTTYSSNGHTLIGALVGGPTSADGAYTDSLQDYTANEVALDYNAGLVGAAAGLYSVYKTGSVDSNIEGVGNVKVEPVETTTTTAVTTAEPVTTTVTTKATNPPVTTATPSSSGVYSIKPNETIDYSKLPENDKMIGWEWSKFGIPANEKVTKVEINISTTNGNIGKWQGAFGSSTTVSPDYWTQTGDMQQTISSNSGTITWNVDTATSNIIQYNYGGELKWGIWWIDCGTFKIDSIKVYTTGSSAVTTTTPKVTTVTTAKATTVTTAKATTVATTKATTATTKATTAGTVNPGTKATLLGDVTNDGIIDVRDVTMLNQYIVKLNTLNEQQLANADVIADGKVDLKDLGQLKKYLIKVISSL